MKLTSPLYALRKRSDKPCSISRRSSIEYPAVPPAYYASDRHEYKAQPREILFAYKTDRHVIREKFKGQLTKKMLFYRSESIERRKRNRDQHINLIAPQQGVYHVCKYLCLLFSIETELKEAIGRRFDGDGLSYSYDATRTLRAPCPCLTSPNGRPCTHLSASSKTSGWA